ncbi:hypothetical protein ACFW04_000798 [Cataglyphis niger]
MSCLLENVALCVRAEAIFQLDDAHYSRQAREFLNAHYPERWIGHGPIIWPARSPDLNVLDYFVWRYIKNLVDRLFNTTPEMAYRATRDIIRKAEFYLREQGEHFE